MRQLPATHPPYTRHARCHARVQVGLRGREMTPHTARCCGYARCIHPITAPPARTRTRVQRLSSQLGHDLLCFRQPLRRVLPLAPLPHRPTLRGTLHERRARLAARHGPLPVRLRRGLWLWLWLWRCVGV